MQIFIENFLDDDNALGKINDIIHDIETCRETQADIDRIYCNIKNMIFNEMDVKVPQFGKGSHHTKHRNVNFNKPFWDNDLDTLYTKIVEVEKELKLCKHRVKKRKLRFALKIARSNFDRNYRSKERKFNNEKYLEIEEFCTKDSAQFWES